MLKPRHARAARMCALNGLGKLHLVADQYDVLGADPHGENIGEADLSRFVDKEVVKRLIEIGTGEEPRRSGDQAMSALRRSVIVERVGDHRATEELLFAA